MGCTGKRYTTILSIAGSDCSGGAGIQADIKTAQALGVYACTAITSVTAQNTTGISAKMDVDSYVLRQQLEQIITDEPPMAVKTGMLPSPDATIAVAEVLGKHGCSNIVVDPVLISTSGTPLTHPLDESAKVMKEILFPMARLITPNIPEAEFLSGISLSEPKPYTLYHVLQRMNAKSILIKGGHSTGRLSADILICEEGQEEFADERIETTNTHGTGCVLSTAIACGLANGLSLKKSISLAKKFINHALSRGSAYSFGKGNGPLYLFGDGFRQNDTDK